MSQPTDVSASCRVAFIGAGSMGREHARAFRDVPGVTLAGIVSRTRPRAEALAEEIGIAAVCDSIHELYERTHADLVVISVPELSVREVCVSAFAFPWTALIEKPAGYDVADAEKIAAEAKRRQRQAYVALNRRMYSSTQAALADVNQREEPRYIRVLDQQDQKAALAAGQPPLVVRNWMFANSIHTVDYLRVFGRGRITSVDPIIPWDPDKPGVVVARVSFDSGDQGLYEGIWDGPGPWAVTVATPARRWELRPLEKAAFQNRGERTLHDAELNPWDTTFKAGFRQQAALVVDTVHGIGSDRLATLDDGLETMRLVQQIFR